MSQFLLTFRTKYLITVSSVGITKMLMGGRCSRAKRAKKNFSGPSWGGQKKLIVWFNCDEHVPIYLQQFPSYSNRKCKKSPFWRTAAHIFVSPGDAPATITQCCMDGKKFNAYQTPRSKYRSIFNSFLVMRCLSQRVSPKIAIFTT